ncbi:MAG TPA: YMGG-like glycine zipper-containing protein [Gemmatimonadaceae bacterium]|nr:YMGG-like glycine zipper-containing protein [Gemmatimonadaceae bacterium]
MTISRAFASAATLVILATLAACGRKDETAALDQALRNDLSLASQAQPYQPQMYVSPTEQGYGYPPQGYYPQPAYPPQYTPQPYYPQAPQRVVYRQAPAPRVIRRAPAPSSEPVYTGAAAGGGVYGDEAVVKNTKRDAIIGAAAGAAIGVASTRNTLKGAIIGAAAGGLLGAVYGEKIDVQRRPR